MERYRRGLTERFCRGNEKGLSSDLCLPTFSDLVSFIPRSKEAALKGKSSHEKLISNNFSGHQHCKFLIKLPRNIIAGLLTEAGPDNSKGSSFQEHMIPPTKQKGEKEHIRKRSCPCTFTRKRNNK